MTNTKIDSSVTTVQNNLVTKKTLAEYLKVSTRTITRLMADDSIPYIKVGRTAVRFNLESVLTALEGGRS